MTLLFDGVTIFDFVNWTVPTTRNQTPLGIVVGIFRATAAIDVNTKNILYGLRVSVSLSKARPDLVASAIHAEQAKLLTTGVVIVRDDSGTDRITTDSAWILASIFAGDPAAGFAGRFVPHTVFEFQGVTAPTFTP